MTNFFKKPKINSHFKDELRGRVLQEYETSHRPGFSWKMFFPMATSLALMLFVVVRIMPERFGLTTNIVIPSQPSNLPTNSINDTPPESIEEIETDLAEIENLLENDEEIIQAINFEEL